MFKIGTIILYIVCLQCTVDSVNAQVIELHSKYTEYESNDAYPYGRLNPSAPEETSQFSFMVGACDCVDSLKNPADGKWYVFKTVWNAKYIMNGFAIQDIGWNPVFAVTSIRAYDETTNEWKVTFFRMPGYQSGVWKGSKIGDKMVMKQQTTGIGGVSGESKLTFYDIDDTGFRWKSEFFGEDGSYSSGWKIRCVKR